MRFLITLAAGTLVAATPLAGQDTRQQVTTFQFPSFTTEQNWARVSVLWTASAVASIAYAKARGQTVEEYGHWLGDFFAPGWGQPNSGSAVRYARGIQNNLRSLSGTTIELLSVHDTAVTMRVSRPWVNTFTGPGHSYLGVTLDEYETVNRLFSEQVGRYLGLRYEQHIHSAWTIMTISGRGASSIVEFPRARFGSTLSATDLPTSPQLAGSWEATFAPDGRFTLTHNGQVVVSGSYELAYDQVVFRNESDALACTTPAKYRWTVNPSNGNLSFGRLADDCDGRYRVLTRRAFTRR